MDTATNDVLDEGDVARMLKVHKTTLWEMRKRGEGPPFRRIGRLYRYSRSAVLEWLAASQGKGEAAPVLTHPEPAAPKKPRARSPKRAEVAPDLVAAADRVLDHLNAKRIEAGKRFDGRSLRALGKAADGTYLDTARKLVLDRLRDKPRELWPDNETLIKAVIDRCAQQAEGSEKSLQHLDLLTPFRVANFERVVGWLDLPAPDTRPASHSSSKWDIDPPTETDTPPDGDALPFD